jgi:hypothetical protein
MKSSVQLKTAIPLLFITVAFACVGFLASNSFGVVPPADGGYPGGNTAEGQAALLNLTTGGYNTAVGWLSLRSDATNSFNTAIGAGTLLANTADQNTATGAGALFSNTTGIQNMANGAFALFSNATGSQNTASGVNALFSNTTGNFNTANGVAALFDNTTGSNNTALGFLAGTGVATANNVICIGHPGADVSNSCFIGNIRGVTTANPDAIPVQIDSAGQLGTMSSSRRFKKEIKAMDKASEAILALKPVTFHYKSDNTKRPEFGLIAEEVADISPDLVVRDENGEVYTVRYDAVNAMLLNEFLKEHRRNEMQESRIQAQEATIARQQKQIEGLTAGLQKVSAQLAAASPSFGGLELNKSAPQTVLND